MYHIEALYYTHHICYVKFLAAHPRNNGLLLLGGNSKIIPKVNNDLFKNKVNARSKAHFCTKHRPGLYMLVYFPWNSEEGPQKMPY